MRYEAGALAVASKADDVAFEEVSKQPSGLCHVVMCHVICKFVYDADGTMFGKKHTIGGGKSWFLYDVGLKSRCVNVQRLRTCLTKKLLTRVAAFLTFRAARLLPFDWSLASFTFCGDVRAI